VAVEEIQTGAVDKTWWKKLAITATTYIVSTVSDNVINVRERIFVKFFGAGMSALLAIMHPTFVMMIIMTPKEADYQFKGVLRQKHLHFATFLCLKEDIAKLSLFNLWGFSWSPAR